LRVDGRGQFGRDDGPKSSAGDGFDLRPELQELRGLNHYNATIDAVSLQSSEIGGIKDDVTAKPGNSIDLQQVCTDHGLLQHVENVGKR
jgi:hypothetical protein